MEHLQTIPSTMADRERPFVIERARNGDQFGSQKSLSNASRQRSAESHQYPTSAVESSPRPSSSLTNGHQITAGSGSSTMNGQFSHSNRFEPPKRNMG